MYGGPLVLVAADLSGDSRPSVWTHTAVSLPVNVLPVMTTGQTEDGGWLV